MVSLSLLSSSRSARVILAGAGMLALGIASADARVGGGSSAGSRGARTYTAPPPTNTAPKAAQPIERSMTQPSATQSARPAATAAAARPAAAPSRFAGGFGSMLMGGLIGAGLFGLLSGHGLFGGMSGLASILGLVLQAGLIGGLIWLAYSFFRGRQTAMAGAGAGMGSMGGGPLGGNGMLRQASNPGGSSMGAALGMGGGAAATSALAVEKVDFDAFERLLGQIQDAYGREDTPALRGLATPEMMSFFSDDLAENARKGLRNAVSDAKLLQGDLAEAWRERDVDYATVAMRFELLDTMVERASGRVVSGNAQVPQEVSEIWTFERRRGGGADGWRLGAIQQVS